METYHEIKETAYVLILAGSLDGYNAGEIDHILKRAIKSRKKNILIDCRNLTYISTSGIGIFLSNLPELKEKSIALIFFGMKLNVRKVFNFMGLDTILTIQDGLPEELLDVTHG